MLRDFMDKCHAGEKLTRFSALVDGDMRFVPVDYSISKGDDSNVLRIKLKTRQLASNHTENLTMLVYFGKSVRDASKMEISGVSFQYIPNSSTTLVATNPIFSSKNSFFSAVMKPLDIVVREMLVELVSDICNELPKLTKLSCGMIWPNISLTYNKRKNMYSYNVDYLYGKNAMDKYNILWDYEIQYNTDMYEMLNS
jgi:hypothetical protein